MKLIVLVTIIFFKINSYAGPVAYPTSPDPELTPGSFCRNPSSYRHPEQVPYCLRDVNSFLKEAVFISYRKVLGFSLTGDRLNYKVDHFIPLCFGGSNDQNNLWPQHASISKITDPIEAIGCEKLGAGKITYKESLELVIKAKLNLKEAPRIFKYLKSLK